MTFHLRMSCDAGLIGAFQQTPKGPPELPQLHPLNPHASYCTGTLHLYGYHYIRHGF